MDIRKVGSRLCLVDRSTRVIEGIPERMIRRMRVGPSRIRCEFCGEMHTRHCWGHRYLHHYEHGLYCVLAVDYAKYYCPGINTHYSFSTLDIALPSARYSHALKEFIMNAFAGQTYEKGRKQVLEELGLEIEPSTVYDWFKAAQASHPRQRCRR